MGLANRRRIGKRHTLVIYCKLFRDGARKSAPGHFPILVWVVSATRSGCADLARVLVEPFGPRGVSIPLIKPMLPC